MLSFPPDDSSFESRGGGDEWSVPPALRPAYKMPDLVSSSTWQRLSGQHPAPMVFPLTDSLHCGRVFQGRFFSKHLPEETGGEIVSFILNRF